MRKLVSLFALCTCTSMQLWADKVQVSTTEPNAQAKPEHLYTMQNGNGLYANATTAPTQTEENRGLFAFYAVPNKADAYYVYSHSAKKWLTYTQADSYNNGISFVKMSDTKVENAYFKVSNYAGDNYELQPYTTSGTNDKYLNWYSGTSQNPLDGTTTLGLWQDGGGKDGGSRYTFTEVSIKSYTYTISAPEGVKVTIGGKEYTNGKTYTQEGSLKKDNVSVNVAANQFAAISIDDVKGTINVQVVTIPEQADKELYTNAVLYPQQQEAVGVATIETKDNVYTLSNKVLAASFMKVGDALFFAGSKAMDLQAGTEPFTVAFGSGDNVPASAMTLKSVETADLKPVENAVGGAEHYNGKAIVANYEYKYKDSLVQIVWRAVLRDGSHYLRTEMELKGVNNVDMFNIIPMIYNVDTKKAGSTPAAIGNTRGQVLVSNKIFAGIETPTGYNTIGGATGDEDKWTLEQTLDPVGLTKDSWTQVEKENIPNRVIEATGKNHPNIMAHEIENVTLKKNQKVEILVKYKAGANRLNLGGVDLLDGSKNISASDYHSAFTGNAHSNNTFTFIAPNDGTFSLRLFAENASEPITASCDVTTTIYNPKEGAIVTADIVGMQGRWSRNTTLEAGETWKVSSVVGLIAQDGKQAETDLTKTQKRRSFLAYSERERAVPWRANPVYISWYELNIDRNNAQDPTKNFVSKQMEDVVSHWKKDMYDRYGVAPRSFVIDDGWDNYGTWTFHAGFPNEMRDFSKIAAEMNAGVGAWLGPVGGYGQSGNYRRQYWNGKGGMQLSNPAYYKVFKDAAYNLTQNQGDFTFFKFDGISAQFSATGPDAGDTGNENAEGIIRLERYVREELKRDIFFNTTVGTWASPFWYQYTDATWRQEGDYGEMGNNKIDREKWITYRDNLVHQNYVTNSPLCPINTLMTHGFILTKYGAVSKNMDYEAVLRELRCAFVCGSGMVELYNDYPLMNSINKGQLWADLAECISWQKRNADVLPDAHWVGGDPWTGSKSEVYGWAAWNGKKSTLALRNGANEAQTYKFTLREALNIPANVTGKIVLRKSFGVQDALEGLTEGQAIDIDQQLTVTLPASSLFSYDGLDAAVTPQAVTGINLTPETAEKTVVEGKNYVIKATVAPAEASFPALVWTSSDENVATVRGGLVQAKKEGKVTITATAIDGSEVKSTIELTVTSKVQEPYAVNFDKDATPSRTDRQLQSVKLTVNNKAESAQQITLNGNQCYYDLTEAPEGQLTCQTGDMLKVALAHKGNWMNAAAFIDLSNDGKFSFNEGQTDQTGTDVMTFSFYSGNFNDDSKGVNSAGEELTGGNRNTMDCPEFTAPAKAGKYRIRFKYDWNSVDPGGQLAADGTPTGTNGILANGGAIVDAILEVTDAQTGIEGVTTETNKDVIYDLSGRRLNETPAKGVYIKNNKKYVK